MNDIAGKAMASSNPTKFPTGSIIVREKLAKRDDVKPQLVALMVKRGPGFSPKSGDWEYLVVDGGLTKVKQRQRTGACNDCHSGQLNRDFVLTLGVPEQR